MKPGPAFGSVLNCTLLKTYVRVVETGNISAAARSLYLAQSAVSAQLSILTRAVGMQLLERVHGSWETTATGRIVYERARQLLQLVENLERDIQDTVKAVVGHVVVASTRTVTDTVLPEIIAGFSERFPDIRIEVFAGNRQDAELRLASDEVDAALVALPFGKKGFKFHPFAADRLLLVVPEAHALAEREAVGFSEIENERFVLFEPGAGTRALLEERLGPRFAELDVRLALNSNDGLVAAVEAGLGITFLPERAARRWAKIGSVRVLSISDLDLTRDLAVAIREGVVHSNAVLAFVEHVALRAIGGMRDGDGSPAE